ncbi:hypothetical protein Dimus_037401, partial [Dionaea muscipula]
HCLLKEAPPLLVEGGYPPKERSVARSAASLHAISAGCSPGIDVHLLPLSWRPTTRPTWPPEAIIARVCMASLLAAWREGITCPVLAEEDAGARCMKRDPLLAA